MTKSSHCQSSSLIGCLSVICLRGASQKKADSSMCSLNGTRSKYRVLVTSLETSHQAPLF